MFCTLEHVWESAAKGRHYSNALSRVIKCLRRVSKLMSADCKRDIVTQFQICHILKDFATFPRFERL